MTDRARAVKEGFGGRCPVGRRRVVVRQGMTNDEADAWLSRNGGYRTVRGVDMLVYELHRANGPETEGEIVGFGVPDALPPPPLDDVKRFLVRWFVGAYGT
jgi:hypothetical protein